MREQADLVLRVEQPAPLAVYARGIVVRVAAGNVASPQDAAAPGVAAFFPAEAGTCIEAERVELFFVDVVAIFQVGTGIGESDGMFGLAVGSGAPVLLADVVGQFHVLAFMRRRMPCISRHDSPCICQPSAWL